MTYTTNEVLKTCRIVYNRHFCNYLSPEQLVKIGIEQEDIYLETVVAVLKLVKTSEIKNLRAYCSLKMNSIALDFVKYGKNNGRSQIVSYDDPKYLEFTDSTESYDPLTVINTNLSQWLRRYSEDGKLNEIICMEYNKELTNEEAAERLGLERTQYWRRKKALFDSIRKEHTFDSLVETLVR